jgi:hypothetical protein
VIPRLSWSTAAAIGATALTIVAMFFDHMVDVEEPFPADAPAFAISVALILVLAAIVFGVVVRRTISAPASADRAGKRGLVCSILSVLALPGIWLGLPFVLAGAVSRWEFSVAAAAADAWLWPRPPSVSSSSYSGSSAPTGGPTARGST